MPRKSIDFSKCCFYRLVCKDVTVKECYVGHTTNETNRRRCHKSRCTNEKNKGHNLVVYKFIRSNGGWVNWILIVHEQLAVKNKAAAVLRERYWLEFYKATLNKNVPGRTDAEYYADHVEEAAAYHMAHRDAHNQRTAAYDLANEAHLKEKHDCPCGSKFTTQHRSHHLKTARHCAYLAALPVL
jgi:hypothetical protein